MHTLTKRKSPDDQKSHPTIKESAKLNRTKAINWDDLSEGPNLAQRHCDQPSSGLAKSQPNERNFYDNNEDETSITTKISAGVKLFDD